MSSNWTEARGRWEGIPRGENFYLEHLNPSRTPSCFLREKIPHPGPKRVRIPLGTQDPGGRGQGHNDSLGGITGSLWEKLRLRGGRRGLWEPTGEESEAGSVPCSSAMTFGSRLVTQAPDA